MSVRLVTVGGPVSSTSTSEGRPIQNRAEPWMAEPSVQGGIYSVF